MPYLSALLVYCPVYLHRQSKRTQKLLLSIGTLNAALVKIGMQSGRIQTGRKGLCNRDFYWKHFWPFASASC